MRTALGCGAAVIVSLLFFAPPAAAATLHASPNSGSTSDATCAITTCEIGHAIAVSHDGDTIVLSAGTYEADALGRLTINKAITIAGDPSGARPVFTSSNDPPVGFTASNATLRYVTLQASNGYALGYNNFVNGLTLDRVLAQAPHGSVLNGTATIANSVLKSTDGSYGALSVQQFRQDDSGDPGVVSVVNSTLTGPTALDMQSFCFFAGATNNYYDSHVRMRNTLLRATNDVAFPDSNDSNCDEPSWGARLDVDYSNYRPSTIANPTGPATTLTEGTHNQTDNRSTDVVEEDGGFRETASSPTIDGGNDADAIGTLDYFGHARIYGSAVDIGAAEYTPVAGPAAFDLTAPADGASYWNSEPTLEWESSSGADHYVLYIDGNVKQQGITGTSVTLADDLPDGTHTWKVVGVNSAGGETDSTSTRTFVLDLDGPSSFILTSPVSGEVLQASPQFDWSASSGADHYDLYIDGAVNRSGLTTGSATPASPLSEGAHTWKVVAVDTHGRTTDSTQTNTFTVDATPPGAFALSSPAQNGYVATTSPLLQWAAAPGADRYDIVIDGATDHRVFGTSDQPLHPLAAGSHTWKVVAMDAAGNATDSSSTRTFTVDTTPPGAFALSAPADNALVAESPTLSWAAASGADHYSLVIDGTTDRTDITSTSVSPAAPLSEGAHTWKVVAVDAAGNTTNSSSTRSITVDATPPGAFDLAAPGDNARLDSASPELSWAAAAGADSYTLVIDDVTSATGLHDTKATPSAPLADGTHTWKVIARDTVGHTTASAKRTFTIDTAKTPAPPDTGTPGAGTSGPPTPGPQPQPEPPATAFSIVSKRAARSGAVTLKVRVSGAGALSAAAKPAGKKWTAASGKATAKGAGTVELVLKPSSKAKRSGGNLKVTVVVTFKPAGGGASVTKTLKLTLKLPRD